MFFDIYVFFNVLKNIYRDNTNGRLCSLRFMSFLMYWKIYIEIILMADIIHILVK